MVPVALDSAVETTFPVPEATSTGKCLLIQKQHSLKSWPHNSKGMMNAAGTLSAVCLIFAMDGLRDKDEPYYMFKSMYLSTNA
jgi:hypothetical protein